MLQADTAVGSFLTALKDTAGKSLNIVDGDSAVISLVSQGQTYTSTISITNSFTLASLLQSVDTNYAPVATTVAAGTAIGSDTSGQAVYTPNGKAAVTLTAKGSGIDSQISGYTITISDKNGNAKKSANEKLEFTNVVYAADQQTEDHSVKIHVGAAAGQTISIGLADMRAQALGLQASDATVLSVATIDKANAAISAFDFALSKALDQATTIGAIEARLEYTASNLTTSSENVQAAESTIRDADMAKEMTNYTKNNVLLQAAQSMLAQANQNSSAVLSLLQ
jgi:flagellin